MLASRYAEKSPEDAPQTTPTRKTSVDEKPLPPVPGSSGGLGASRYAGADEESQSMKSTPTKSRSQERNVIEPTSTGKTPIIRSPEAKKREARRTSSVQLDHAKSQSTELQSALGINSPPADEPPTTNGKGADASETVSPVPTPAEPATVTVSEVAKHAPEPSLDSTANGEIASKAPVLVPLENAVPVKPQTPDIPRAGTPGGPRLVRKTKRGKLVAIRVPPGEVHTRDNWMPLSSEEVKARLDAFERDGYDTRGFGYWNYGDDAQEATANQGQVIPNEVAGIVRETPDEKPQVAIPDKNRWDSYVQDLMEEKLRALGVSTADEEPPPQPPSRTESAQYPHLAMSPPVPTSSTASQHMYQNNLPFSAPFSPGTSTNDTSLGAIASPALSLNQQLRPGHLSRQSTFGIPSVPTPSSSYTPQGPPPMWSPQLPMGQQQGFTGSAQQFNFPSGTPDFFADRQQTPRAFEAQQEQSQYFKPSHSPAPPSASVEIKSASSDAIENRPATPPQAINEQYTDLAYPTPRGHRHNISAQLEKEAENPQYYPGEYVDDSRVTRDEGELPNLGFPDASSGPFQFGKSRAVGHQPTASMASNASASRLNVEAKEFKFNPQNSHGKTFSMSKAALMPEAGPQPPRDWAKPTVSYVTAHSGGGSTGDADFRASAKAFKPESSGFAFSSEAFNFAAEKQKADEPQKEKTPEPPSGFRIFGGFNISDIIKPTKKSKAIPIVNPNDVPKKEEEEAAENSDADGRVQVDASRVKRGKISTVDGDDVPRFAEPTPEPPILKSNAPVPAALSERTTLSQEKLTPTEQPDNSSGEATQEIASQSALPQSDLPKPAEPPSKDGAEGLENDTVDENSDVAWHDFGIESLREQSRRRNVNGSDAIRSLSPPLHRASNPASRGSEGRDSPLPPFEGTPTPGEPEEDQSSSAGTEDLRQRERLQKRTPEPSMQELNDIMDHINRHEEEGRTKDEDADEHRLRDQKRYVPPHLRESKGDASMDTSTALKSLREPSPPPVLRPVSPPSDLLSGDMHDIKNPGLQTHVSLKPSKAETKRASRSPVRRLNNLREPAVSDWDDTFSPTEDFKLLPRPQQSDTQMKLLFEGLLKAHLDPLQKSIRDLQERQPSTRDLATSRLSSHDQDKSSSDADDEDDESDASASKKRASKADRKNEKLRVAVIDAIKSTQSHGLSQAVEQMRLRNEAESKSAELQRLLTISEKEIELYKESTENHEQRIRDLEGDRRGLLQQIAAAEKTESEIKKNMSDLEVELAKREKLINEYRSSSAQWEEASSNARKTSEELMNKIDQFKQDASDQRIAREGLENKLTNLEKSLAEAQETLTKERVEFQEAKIELSRKHAEALEELEDTLKNEGAISKAAAEELNRKHAHAIAEAEDAQKNERVTWQATNEELNRKLAQALTDADESLKNERASWQREKEELNVKHFKALAEADENFKNERALWQKEKEETNRKHVRAFSDAQATLRTDNDTKLANAEKALAEAQTTMKNERATWTANNEEQSRKNAKAVADIEDALRTERAHSQQWEEEQTRKLETIKLRLDESVRQRGLAEKEIVRLAAQERELIKKNVMLEEVQNSNSRLQNEIEQVRGEAIRHQRAATHHQHEAAETKRDIEAEVRRAKNSLEAEVEIANRKVESIRTELDTRMSFMKSELETARSNAASTKQRLEKELEFAQNSRQEALQTISQASNSSLKEERKKFERSLKEMTTQHDRALKVAIEDKERIESALREKLDAAQQKHELFEDKVNHLEDKVAVAQAAAKSAAESARSAAVRSPVAAKAASSLPEKISPQALRESIAVLQEQLQERETRIEDLESQLSKSTADEGKLRERDTEVSWLRELLNVRIDDLADLVNTLSNEDFDRDSARNAAIRIQANLQMERQEKDRPGRSPTTRSPAGRPPPPSLPSLQDFQNFASPKAAQLAAAWSSWRKGKDGASVSNLREAMNSTPSRAVSSPVVAEGSASAQSFLSGLMTPPASNLRRSPSFEKPPPPLTLAPEAAIPTSPPQRGNKSSRRSTYALPTRDRTPEARPGSRESLPPKTPPLMRKGSYDQDASMAEPTIEDDEDDVAQPEGGPSAAQTVESTQLEPLGEVIANE